MPDGEVSGSFQESKETVSEVVSYSAQYGFTASHFNGRDVTISRRIRALLRLYYGKYLLGVIWFMGVILQRDAWNAGLRRKFRHGFGQLFTQLLGNVE